MLASTHEMLDKAAAGKYAVGQFNINNLEWIGAILAAAEKCRAPVILGVTEAAANYMGGARVVGAMVHAILERRNLDLPVALHLDHASHSTCLEAIGAGFTSVMFDGSHMPFAENLRIAAELAEFCKSRGVSLETELGSPAGEEDGIKGSGERADPAQCSQMAKSGITILAASCGNIHGKYPAGWEGLDFPLLEKIHTAVHGLPLALHGGTGIPDEMIRKAINLGIAKINVNTECQIAFADALRAYFEDGHDKQSKGYSLQKLMAPGIAAIEAKVAEKIHLFGSAGVCA